MSHCLVMFRLYFRFSQGIIGLVCYRLCDKVKNDYLTRDKLIQSSATCDKLQAIT